jgi:hypothetical protein
VINVVVINKVRNDILILLFVLKLKIYLLQNCAIESKTVLACNNELPRILLSFKQIT